MKKNVEKGYPYRNRDILVIDLTKDEYSFVSISEEIGKQYHGGRALAYKLWDDYANWETINENCLYVGAPIIITLGVSNDLGFNFSSSSTLMSYSLESKSVVTYNFSSKKLSLAISSLGFCAIVIKGRARRLTKIEIFRNKINIDLCETFHNLSTREIEREHETAASLISIGASGENRSIYSSINIDSQNVGRAGIGAIFGEKNLKCVAIYNNEQVIRTPYYDRYVDEVFKYFDNKPKVNYLNSANELGWGAIESFQYRYDPRLWGLGSELTKDCTLDWLNALALGANIGIYDYNKVEILQEKCLDLALDPFSVSIFLNWALFAEDQGIIDLKIDKNIKFLNRLILLLEALSSAKGSFSSINESVSNLAEKYGFDKNNFTSFGKELLPLDLRGLNAFSIAVAIDDDTFVPWEMFRELNKKDSAKALFYSQIYREICESLGISWKNVLYLANIDGSYKKENNKFIKILLKLFALSEGYNISEEQLIQFGKESFFHRRAIECQSRDNCKYSISNIPIYFLTNRICNFKKESIVSIAGELDKYLTILEYEKEKLNIQI